MKMPEELNIYLVEHTHDDKGEGGTSFCLFKARERPDDEAIVRFMDIDFEPDQGEELHVHCYGRAESLPFLEMAVPPLPRYYNAAVNRGIHAGLDIALVDEGAKEIYTLLTDRWGNSLTGTPVPDYMLDAMYGDMTFVALNHEGEFGLLIEIEYPTLQSDDCPGKTFEMWEKDVPDPTHENVARYLAERLQVLERSHGGEISISHNGYFDRTLAHFWLPAVGPHIAENVQAATDWMLRQTGYNVPTEEKQNG